MCNFWLFGGKDEIVIMPRQHSVQNLRSIFAIYVEKHNSFPCVFTFLEKMIKYKQKEGDNNV